MKNPKKIVVLPILILVLLGIGFLSRLAPAASVITPATEIAPIPWGTLEKRLIEAGVIDPTKLRGGELSRLNLLWAFGLANKNPVLTKGPMMSRGREAAGGFASTGGWTLAKGDAMDHYASHEFIALTPDRQKLVEKMAQNIYRPCCGNSVYFPDCNHGMAMLGLLEILASRGASEEEMWKQALAMNRQWFPDHYQLISDYLALANRKISQLKPAELLSVKYSSGQAAATMTATVKPQQPSGSSCAA